MSGGTCGTGDGPVADGPVGDGPVAGRPVMERGATQPVRFMNPGAIERESFRIISETLKRDLGPEAPAGLTPDERAVLVRVIHTTADLEFARAMVFSHDAVRSGVDAMASGAGIVVDTRMVEAGVNRRWIERLGCEVRCYGSLPGVAEEAAERGVTRALVAVERAAADPRNRVFVVGNSPTALLRLCDLVRAGALSPALVVGVPVGFVNVVESKERVLELPIPSIVARGRRGGSTVAVAILNALGAIGAARCADGCTGSRGDSRVVMPK